MTSMAVLTTDHSQYQILTTYMNVHMTLILNPYA